MARMLLGAAVGLVAVVVGLVVAPLVRGVAVWIGIGWMPVDLLRLAGHVAYEASIWFSGVAVWLAANRLQVLDGWRAGVGVIAAPAFADALGGVVLGLPAPGISTWTGFAAQLPVAAVALALGLRLRRRTDQ